MLFSALLSIAQDEMFRVLNSLNRGVELTEFSKRKPDGTDFVLMSDKDYDEEINKFVVSVFKEFDRVLPRGSSPASPSSPFVYRTFVQF